MPCSWWPSTSMPGDIPDQAADATLSAAYAALIASPTLGLGSGVQILPGRVVQWQIEADDVPRLNLRISFTVRQEPCQCNLASPEILQRPQRPAPVRIPSHPPDDEVTAMATSLHLHQPPGQDQAPTALTSGACRAPTPSWSQRLHQPAERAKRRPRPDPTFSTWVQRTARRLGVRRNRFRRRTRWFRNCRHRPRPMARLLRLRLPETVTASVRTNTTQSPRSPIRCRSTIFNDGAKHRAKDGGFRY